MILLTSEKNIGVIYLYPHQKCFFFPLALMPICQGLAVLENLFFLKHTIIINSWNLST